MCFRNEDLFCAANEIPELRMAHQTSKNRTNDELKAKLYWKQYTPHNAMESNYFQEVFCIQKEEKNWIIRLKWINDKMANGICFIHFQWKIMLLLCIICYQNCLWKFLCTSIQSQIVYYASLIYAMDFIKITPLNAFRMNRWNLFDGNSKFILFFRSSNQIFALASSAACFCRWIWIDGAFVTELSFELIAANHSSWLWLLLFIDIALCVFHTFTNNGFGSLVIAHWHWKLCSEYSVHSHLGSSITCVYM